MVNDTSFDVLLASAVRQDQVACEELYLHFVQPIYRLAYGMLLNKQDAEEVVQDSFGYAFRSLGQFDSSRSNFRTWLYQITISRCRNRLRKKWLPEVSVDEIADFAVSGGPSPESVAEVRHAQREVWEALKTLSPKLREAIVLRYFDGMPYKEMAAVIGCPQKTAESRVRLAHEAMYGLLADKAASLFEGLVRQ